MYVRTWPGGVNLDKVMLGAARLWRHCLIALGLDKELAHRFVGKG